MLTASSALVLNSFHRLLKLKNIFTPKYLPCVGNGNSGPPFHRWSTSAGAEAVITASDASVSCHTTKIIATIAILVFYGKIHCLLSTF